MFEIAPEVIRWHAAGRDAVLARVSVTGLSSNWPGQAVALSSDHGKCRSPSSIVYAAQPGSTWGLHPPKR